MISMMMLNFIQRVDGVWSERNAHSYTPRDSYTMREKIASLRPFPVGVVFQQVSVGHMWLELQCSPHKQSFIFPHSHSLSAIEKIAE